jgi:hypothetical protein
MSASRNEVAGEPAGVMRVLSSRPESARLIRRVSIGCFLQCSHDLPALQRALWCEHVSTQALEMA